MTRCLFFIFFLITCSVAFGQLNTKTKTNEDGSTTTTSYHKNGRPSTIETWDKDHRWGNLQGLNSEQKEIFNYGLRKVGGHASVYLSYYSNGQVKKAEFSSMPDGGIQWERYIHEFDELGNQTAYMDLSMNTGRETLFVDDTLKTKKPVVVIQKPEVIECSILLITNYQLVNETEKVVIVTMKANANQYLAFSDTTITLQPKQTFRFNSSTMAQIFLPEDAFEVKEIKGKRKKEKYKFLIAQPVEEKNFMTYSWHILKI
jgi:YD repeat-containing protein